jgi:MFS family permease
MTDPAPREAEGAAGKPDEVSPLPAFRLFYVFLPETSLLRRVRFQIVVISRFLSDIGQKGVFYGALVAVAASGSALEASLIGVAVVLPGATLGFYGGAVSDALPRRVALGVGYMGQAALCVTIPIILGVEFVPLLLLVLGVSILNQFVGPTEKAVVPLVASREQISSAAVILSLTSAVSTGIGSAVIAPVLLKAFDERVLFVVCGAFLVFAAMRIFSLPIRKDVGVKQALQKLNLSEIDLGIGKALSWLLGWPALVTIIMVGVITSVIHTLGSTLAPTYVFEVLAADPANTVYLMTPAAIGAFVSFAIAAKLIDRMGERWAAALAFLVMAVSFFILGFIETVAPVLAPFSPLNLLKIFDVELSDETLAASFMTIFTGFAINLGGVSVQTYINRRVPVLQQGRTFALQAVLGSAAALVPLLLAGAIAELVSINAILVVAPWVVLLGVYALLYIANRLSGREAPKGREVLKSFWEEPEAAR